MLLMYNYVLLKLSTWYSKHVEESNNIWRINNIQCITLVVYGQFMMHGQRNIKVFSLEHNSLSVLSYVTELLIYNYYYYYYYVNCWSQCPRGLRRRSSAASLLRLWVPIRPVAWMFVCCECCVLSGRGLCDELLTRPGESYRLWRVLVCDQETSKTRRLKASYRDVKIQSQWVVTAGKHTNILITIINITTVLK